MDLEDLASAEASGWATASELARLAEDPEEWAQSLRRLLTLTEEGLDSAARLPGGEREQVMADFRSELDRLADALCRLTGEDRRPARLAALVPAGSPADGESLDGAGVPLELPTEPTLQGSWAAGRIVVWAGSPGGGASPLPVLEQLIADADAGSVPWKPGADVLLPDGSAAPARSALVEEILGWLVGVGISGSPAVGASLRWLSEVARWATELVAQGRMVPSLRRAGSGRGASKRTTERYRVKWVPALVDTRQLQRLAQAAPGAVTAVERTIIPEALCRSLLGVVVDAVCRAGAGRLVTPATADVARTRTEVAEAVLSGLDGTPFSAAGRSGWTAGRAPERVDRLRHRRIPIRARSAPRRSHRRRRLAPVGRGDGHRAPASPGGAGPDRGVP